MAQLTYNCPPDRSDAASGDPDEPRGNFGFVPHFTAGGFDVANVERRGSILNKQRFDSVRIREATFKQIAVLDHVRIRMTILAPPAGFTIHWPEICDHSQTVLRAFQQLIQRYGPRYLSGRMRNDRRG